MHNVYQMYFVPISEVRHISVSIFYPKCDKDILFSFVHYNILSMACNKSN